MYFHGNETEVNYGVGIMETIMNHSAYNTKTSHFKDKYIQNVWEGRS